MIIIFVKDTIYLFILYPLYNKILSIFSVSSQAWIFWIWHFPGEHVLPTSTENYLDWKTIWGFSHFHNLTSVIKASVPYNTIIFPSCNNVIPKQIPRANAKHELVNLHLSQCCEEADMQCHGSHWGRPQSWGQSQSTSLCWRCERRMQQVRHAGHG